jgi:hypothetical protein
VIYQGRLTPIPEIALPMRKQIPEGRCLPKRLGALPNRMLAHSITVRTAHASLFRSDVRHAPRHGDSVRISTGSVGRMSFVRRIGSGRDPQGMS